MENQKALEFNGTPGGYFVAVLVYIVGAYIPFFGWAFAFNFVSEWAAENTKVNGRTVAYKAEYVETLKFVAIQAVLTAITFGIYVFWAAPKAMRYFTDHVSFVDGAPAQTAAPIAPVSAPQPPTFQPPIAPQPPLAPQPPVPTEPAVVSPQPPTGPVNPIQ